MMIVSKMPDFDSIKKTNQYDVEYWSARDLALLLGYSKWERFEGAVKRAMIACEQVGQIVENHFPGGGKMVDIGSGAERQMKKKSLNILESKSPNDQ